MTVDDLEWPKRTLAEKKTFTDPTRKKLSECGTTLSGQNVAQ